MVAEPTKLWLQNSKYAKNGAVARNDFDIRRKLVSVLFVGWLASLKTRCVSNAVRSVLRQESLVLRRPSVAVCLCDTFTSY